jgi:DNA-binding response OmpR family regulator
MPSQQNEAVFLIEDDQKMSSLLSTLLEMEGYRVLALETPTPEAIIDIIDTHKPMALIMDVHLATYNGIDLLKLIRSEAQQVSTHVMMTSGEDLRMQCLTAGADGFLLKPYAPTELISWLRTRSQLNNKKEN